MIEINYYNIPISVKFNLSRARKSYSNQIICEIKYKDVIAYGSSSTYKNSLLVNIEIENGIKNYLVKNLNNLSNLHKTRQELSSRYTHLSPELVFATDTALIDLIGKINNTNFFQTVDKKQLRDKAEITEQVFIPDSFENYKKLLNEIHARGTKYLKVKLGFNRSLDKKIFEILISSKLAFGLKLDFNSSYSVDEICSTVRYLESTGLNIVLLEDPLRKDLISDYPSLRKKINIPILLDSYVMNIGALKKAIDNHYLDVLNIKLNRVGGIINAEEYIDVAEDRIPISIGCAEDLGVGMAAIINYSATIKNLFGVEGIGSYRLKTDYINEEFLVQNGIINVLNKGTGVGVVGNKEKIEKLLKYYKGLDIKNKQNELYLKYADLKEKINNRIYKYKNKIKYA